MGPLLSDSMGPLLSENMCWGFRCIFHVHSAALSEMWPYRLTCHSFLMAPHVEIGSHCMTHKKGTFTCFERLLSEFNPIEVNGAMRIYFHWNQWGRVAVKVVHSCAILSSVTPKWLRSEQGLKLHSRQMAVYKAEIYISLWLESSICDLWGICGPLQRGHCLHTDSKDFHCIFAFPLTVQAGDGIRPIVLSNCAD